MATGNAAANALLWVPRQSTDRRGQCIDEGSRATHRSPRPNSRTVCEANSDPRSNHPNQGVLRELSTSPGKAPELITSEYL